MLILFLNSGQIFYSLFLNYVWFSLLILCKVVCYNKIQTLSVKFSLYLEDWHLWVTDHKTMFLIGVSYKPYCVYLCPYRIACASCAYCVWREYNIGYLLGHLLAPLTSFKMIILSNLFRLTFSRSLIRQGAMVAFSTAPSQYLFSHGYWYILHSLESDILAVCIQGDPSPRGPGLGWLRFGMFHLELL